MLIAGANGFIARHLTDYFSQCGWQVVGLARRQEGMHEACRYVNWDGVSLGDWVEEIDACDVLVNLVGRSINCRHTEENKKQILDSRVKSTELLGQAVKNSESPPHLWINASGVGFYQETFDLSHDENGPKGEGFIADVVDAWEEALFAADISSGVRRVALRTAMVVADEPGNPYRVLGMLSRLGLGGKVGSGQQMVSWIHIEDVSRVIEFVIEHEELSGPVNMSAPHAVSNAEMMRRFRKSVGMPLGLPAPTFGVHIGAFFMGTAPELVLGSNWAVPTKLLDTGFVFDYPEMTPWDWS